MIYFDKKIRTLSNLHFIQQKIWKAKILYYICRVFRIALQQYQPSVVTTVVK